eukprot:2209102-Alexandrium_andersonii.AAC.1
MPRNATISFLASCATRACSAWAPAAPSRARAAECSFSARGARAATDYFWHSAASCLQSPGSTPPSAA